MADKEEIQTENITESSQQPHAMQVSIKMQQGEHTGQPIYSNFTAVQGSQGVVMIDFGFLDPQTINALNRMAQSGEKTQTINARMSCRMAISIEAAHQLAQQLDRLLQSKTGARGQVAQAGKGNGEAVSSEVDAAKVDTAASAEKNGGGRIRFPWSSGDKSH